MLNFLCSASSCCIVFRFISKLFLFLFSQIRDARQLFSNLEEKCLMGNSSFLSQLLQTIRRADLLRLLKADSRQLEETDATPLLSEYRWKQRDLSVNLNYRRDFCSPFNTTLLLVLFRVLLYNIYEELCRGDLAKMKFLLRDKLGTKQTEMCNVRTKPSFTPHHSNNLIPISNMEKYCWIVLSFNRGLVKYHLLYYVEQIFPCWLL